MRNWRVTGLGKVLIPVFVAALAISLLADGRVRFLGAAICVLILLIGAGEGLAAGGTIRAEDSRKREVLARDMKTHRRRRRGSG